MNTFQIVIVKLIMKKKTNLYSGWHTAEKSKTKRILQTVPLEQEPKTKTYCKLQEYENQALTWSQDQLIVTLL